MKPRRRYRYRFCIAVLPAWFAGAKQPTPEGYG